MKWVCHPWIEVTVLPVRECQNKKFHKKVQLVKNHENNPSSPILSNNKGTAFGGGSHITQPSGTDKRRYNSPHVWDNTTTPTRKAKLSGNTDGMNGKIFNVGVTQAKQFIDTRMDLAKFFTRDYKNRHWSYQLISEITPIRYNHLKNQQIS